MPNIDRKGQYWKLKYIEMHKSTISKHWFPSRTFTDFSNVSNLYKLVILGSGGVGKSATVIQYVHNHFIVEYGSDSYKSSDFFKEPTMDYHYQKQESIFGTTTILDIIDATGQGGNNSSINNS